jgi:hypothetical protein
MEPLQRTHKELFPVECAGRFKPALNYRKHILRLVQVIPVKGTHQFQLFFMAHGYHALIIAPCAAAVKRKSFAGYSSFADILIPWR